MSAAEFAAVLDRVASVEIDMTNRPEELDEKA